MKGTIKSVKFNEYEVKSGSRKGSKFTKVRIEVDVLTNEEKGYVSTLHGDFSLDYAKRYFEYCGQTSRSAIGQPVEVTIQKRAYESNGEKRIIREIKWFNFLDESGAPIYMRKADDETTPF